jgi:MFS transporter, SP family, solute carrier family 2 (myo-inositol transporter), member 13
MMKDAAYNPVRYGRFLIFISGLGGLLYGIDIGIIAAALLYLSKTVNLTVGQTSFIVAAVLGGSMVSSLIAGVLADLFGRKRMVIASGFLFVASVGLIVLSQGFVPLMAGRLLQGVSGGVIAVVVPLYLAECLSAQHRGRGTAFFQLMLTFGIVVAAATGWFYTHQAEAAIRLAAGDPGLIRAAQNHAWRGMFLSVIYPGLAFFVGGFLLSETPRWLYRKGRTADALLALRRALPEKEVQSEMQSMAEVAAGERQTASRVTHDSLRQRKYVVPFVLACIILACNQATGINSILGFLVIILRQAGMSATHATDADVTVKLLMCVMTAVAMVLVDRKGRKFLLKIGTGGVIVALATAGLLFLGVERQRIDVRDTVQARVDRNALNIPMNAGVFGPGKDGQAMDLTVLYSYGEGDRVASGLSSEPNPVLSIVPAKDSGHPLVIKRALYGPTPTKKTGWLITVCICFFIAFYSVGPGVVVWLTLSELMPTRIRSTGMGIALLLNQGMATLIAAVFLPIVGNYGYSVMFLAWAACTVFYFITAAFFLPETKGKTLEEIEKSFAH